MARPAPLVHAWAACVLATLACGNQAAPDPAASSSAAPSASLPSVSQDDYCKRVCDRATSCGDEAALSVAGKDEAAKDAVKKASAANRAKCVETCMSDKASETRLALSDKCARLTDCKELAKCLEDLARDFRQP